MLLAEEAESASTAKTKPLEHDELLENYFQTTKASKFRTKSGSSWCVELASLPEDDCPKDGLDTCSSSKFHVSLWLHLSWFFFRIWLSPCILEALQLPRVPFLCVFLRHWNFAQYWVPPLHTTCSGKSSSHNYNDAFTQPGKIPSPMSSPPNWTFQQSRLERFGLMVKGVLWSWLCISLLLMFFSLQRATEFVLCWTINIEFVIIDNYGLSIT